jgi:hypothetical protein
LANLCSEGGIGLSTGMGRLDAQESKRQKDKVIKIRGRVPVLPGPLHIKNFSIFDLILRGA